MPVILSITNCKLDNYLAFPVWLKIFVTLNFFFTVKSKY